MTKIVFGAFAHVDSGKTSLAESLLYLSGSLRNKGRVDHRDSFLDFNSEERKRGITIFNKEAHLNYNGKDFIYVDTPGHSELKAEAKRTLKILDAAILIVSANDNSFATSKDFLDSILEFNIPLFIFVNKMDISYFSQGEIIEKLGRQLDKRIVTLDSFFENAALEDEDTMARFLETGEVDKELVRKVLVSHEYIPAIFGSALKDDNTLKLLELISEYANECSESENLNAYVYKIAREKNERITFARILSGALTNRTSFTPNDQVTEILVSDGKDYTQVKEARSGDIVALKGLKTIGIGTYLPSLYSDEKTAKNQLRYRISSDIDAYKLFLLINELNDEMPELNIALNGNSVEISLNGALQQEIISSLIKERYKKDIVFEKPQIIYKETIAADVLGIGHFEPLRHYAEAVVKLSPADKMEYYSRLNDSYISSMLNYLIAFPTHGVLTNSELHNVRVEILEIKTHLKHTEGQDVIEALRRAIRQALLKAENVLLEPNFVVEIFSNDNQIINELIRFQLDFEVGDDSIRAYIPVDSFNEMITDLRSALKDKFVYEASSTIYRPCKRCDEVVAQIGYDPLTDIENPGGSVFCINGAGHYVEPEHVEEYMHIDISAYLNRSVSAYTHNRATISDEELKRVMNNTYKPRERYKPKERVADDDKDTYMIKSSKPLVYLIDGYNLMHSIDELSDIARVDLMSARHKTIDLVCDFAGYVDAECILVFDAYLQEAKKAVVSKEANITLVYTKQNQTADSYIENKANELKDKYNVTVVTSDGLEQLRILSSDSRRLSSREFMVRYDHFRNNLKKRPIFNRPLEQLSELLLADDDE